MVTAEGVEDFTDPQVGYAIVEARTHEEAARIFSEHPQVRLLAGNSIEVLECPPPPGRPG